MCSLRGSLYPCLECKFQLDPVGCRHFREIHGATIIYAKIADVLEDLVFDTYLKDETTEMSEVWYGEVRFGVVG